MTCHELKDIAPPLRETDEPDDLPTASGYGALIVCPKRIFSYYPYCYIYSLIGLRAGMKIKISNTSSNKTKKKKEKKGKKRRKTIRGTNL